MTLFYNYCYLFAFLLIISLTYLVNPVHAETCKPDDLYGINWSVGGCSCAADTITKPKVGAFAEDNLGHSRGWIDARDLTCNTKTGKWTAKAKPKFATCAGCKAGFGTNGTCGPATQKSFASAPTAGLCTCGTPKQVKRAGAWQWQCSVSPSAPPVHCYAPRQVKGGRS